MVGVEHASARSVHPGPGWRLAFGTDDHQHETGVDAQATSAIRAARAKATLDTPDGRMKNLGQGPDAATPGPTRGPKTGLPGSDAGLARRFVAASAADRRPGGG
eukprot:600967-Hanusia_phi.AAC.2